MSPERRKNGGQGRRIDEVVALVLSRVDAWLILASYLVADQLKSIAPHLF